MGVPIINGSVSFPDGSCKLQGTGRSHTFKDSLAASPPPLPKGFWKFSKGLENLAATWTLRLCLPTLLH
jgi:hypothetical protein